MRVLALDPADRCGVAVQSDSVEHGPHTHAEVWQLVVTPEEHRGARLQRLLKSIVAMHGVRPFDLIAYEDASIGSHNPAVQAMHNQKAGIIHLAAYRLGVKAVCYNPSSIKKFATGNGNAEKPQMIAAAQSQLGYQGADPDEADALWVLEMAKHHKGLPMVKAPKKKKSPRRKSKDSNSSRLFK